jgi:hypothetical protein
MGFTTPCFIRKNTPELRKKLAELGYKSGYKKGLDEGVEIVLKELKKKIQ